MRIFLIVWIGQLLSLLGSGLTSFGLAVWIFSRTGQATPFALTLLFSILPNILLSPPAGALVDRVDRKRVMILADTGSALVTLTAAVLLLGDRLEVVHIYLIAAASSAFAAFQAPAYKASISLLVPKNELARANGMVQMAQALQLLVAPVVAGVLFVTIGLAGIILIDFVTFALAILALVAVRIPSPERPESDAGSAGSLLEDLLTGWRYLRARPGLFGLLLYFGVVFFVFSFAHVLVGPLVLAFAAADTLGLTQSAAGVGMLLGTLAISLWGGPQRRALAVTAFIALGGLGFALAGLRPSAWLVGAGLSLLMFAFPLASGPGQAIFQSKVEPGVQGRVFGMQAALTGGMTPLGYLAAGPLADRIFEPLMARTGVLGAGLPGTLLGAGMGRGIGLMFVVGGAVLVLASALAYLHPRIRNVESEIPDAVQPASPPESEPEAAIDLSVRA